MRFNQRTGEAVTATVVTTMLATKPSPTQVARQAEKHVRVGVMVNILGGLNGGKQAYVYGLNGSDVRVRTTKGHTVLNLKLHEVEVAS